jgi:TonB family protein
MMREYPAVLRDNGIGGTVRISFYVDVEGRVQETRITEHSPYEALAEAALSVADVYRFAPALNRDTVVPVWVTFAITFQVVR